MYYNQNMFYYCNISILLPTHYPPTFPISPPSHWHLKHSKITTLVLLSLPTLFLTEGSQYKNFKVSFYFPSWETISDHGIWSLICEPLDHWDTYNGTDLKHFIRWNSCIETLLALYFPKAMQHNFVLEFHTHFEE